MDGNVGYIFGVVYVPILTETVHKYVFSTIQKHLQTLSTFISVEMINDPQYIYFHYELLTNIFLNNPFTHCFKLLFKFCIW